MGNSSKKIVSFVLAVCLIVFSGCNGKEPIIHEGFEDFENCIYRELSDYLLICEPQYYTETDSVQIDVFFDKTYIKNLSSGDCSQYEIIDRFMTLYNAFIIENTDYFFGGNKKVSVNFLEDEGNHTELIAEAANYHSYNHEGLIEDKLISVVYYCPVEYDKLTCKNDIKYINLYYIGRNPSEDVNDYICSIVGLFPNLRFIHVNWNDPEGEIEQRIAQMYPDIIYEV